MVPLLTFEYIENVRAVTSNILLSSEWLHKYTARLLTDRSIIRINRKKQNQDFQKFMKKIKKIYKYWVNERTPSPLSNSGWGQTIITKRWRTMNACEFLRGKKPFMSQSSKCSRVHEIKPAVSHWSINFLNLMVFCFLIIFLVSVNM